MAVRFLNADMDGDPLDLRDGPGDLDDLAMRDVAVGLENHLAPPLLDAVGDRLARLLERRHGPFAVPQKQLRLAARRRGLGQGQESRRRFFDPHPVPRRRYVDLLAAGHLHGEEHERHQLEDDVDHRRHVDVFVAFLVDVAAEQHGGGGTSS